MNIKIASHQNDIKSFETVMEEEREYLNMPAQPSLSVFPNKKPILFLSPRANNQPVKSLKTSYSQTFDL